jgi:hypothetical protein
MLAQESSGGVLCWELMGVTILSYNAHLYCYFSRINISCANLPITTPLEVILREQDATNLRVPFYSVIAARASLK